MLRLITSNLLICATVVLSGCDDPASLDFDVSRTEIHGTLTAYVTSWLDLDTHFGAPVAVVGCGPKLDCRLEGGHHQIRCKEVLQYEYVNVEFEADPQTEYRYRVDCKHNQGGGG